MKFFQIPNIENAWDNVHIETLSPSTFSWIANGCGYQVLLQKALLTFQNKSLLLPSPKNAILGTIIHKLYELTIKGEMQNIADMINKWEELIAFEKNKLTTLYPTLQNASLNDYDKRNRAIRYASRMIKKSDGPSQKGTGIVIRSEERLDCSKIGLMGIADKLVIDNGHVDVIDFKSGHVKDENGVIKTEYSVQLHLYAAMCKHLSLGEPRSLTLVDIDGDNYVIPYSPDLCEKLMREVIDTIQTLNLTINNKQFSPYVKPQLGMCANCSCRHVCQHKVIPTDSYYQTITGVVKEMPSTNMYVLNCGHNIYISGLDVYNVDSPDDYIGKTLTFVNTIKASQIADDYTYKLTENTLVYEQL